MRPPTPCPRPHRAPAELATSYQHVLRQPTLFLRQPAGHPEGKALLPKERVPAVPAPEGDDFPAVRQVRDERQLWVTRPVVHQWLCTGGHIPGEHVTSPPRDPPGQRPRVEGSAYLLFALLILK